MALVSPLSGTYYMNNAERKEEMKVKMVTADDDLTVDIVVEGDVEEIERFRRELNLIEKGMVYVKGVLEK
jgi:acylphosphatase